MVGDIPPSLGDAEATPSTVPSAIPDATHPHPHHSHPHPLPSTPEKDHHHAASHPEPVEPVEPEQDDRVDGDEREARAKERSNSDATPGSARRSSGLVRRDRVGGWVAFSLSYFTVILFYYYCLSLMCRSRPIAFCSGRGGARPSSRSPGRAVRAQSAARGLATS
jgi:hypothetical protein